MPETTMNMADRVFAFDDSHRREFGWFVGSTSPVFVSVASPRKPATGHAVLVVAPIGIESQGAAASLDSLTKSLCGAGHSVVRFDPPGFGNSIGDCPNGPSWDDWITATVELLRATREAFPTGAVAVVSLQLGTPVALAAIDRATSTGVSTDGLVAWAPTINGKRFIRALKMFGAVAADHPVSQAQHDTAGPETSIVESGGYAFGQELQHSISRVNLGTDAKLASVDHLLVVDRDDVASVDPWLKQIAKLQAGSASTLDVASPKTPGTHDAHFEDPEKGVVPVRVCNEIVRWVSALPHGGSGRVSSNGVTQRDAGFGLVSNVSFTIANQPVLETVRIIDAPATDEFGAGALLTITTRLRESPSTPDMSSSHTSPLHPATSVNASATVITSTGANTSSGPGRLNATLARRLASQGSVVVRYDRRGVGGSTGEFRSRPAVSKELAVSAEAYCSEHVGDLEMIVRDLAKTGQTELDLVGICSGATLAYRFVLAGRSVLRVQHLVTINQILWDNGVVDLSQESPLVDAKVTGKLVAAVRSPMSWPQLLRSDLHVRRNILRVARHAAHSVRPHLRHQGASTNPFDRLACAGVEMVQIFDVEEVGLHYAREKFGDSIDKLRREGVLESWIVEGAGHTFGSSWSKRWLEARVAALLLR